MPYQPTRSLTAFFMTDAVKDVIKEPLSILGYVKFGAPYFEFFQFILACLDAYIRGAALGHTFRDKYDLLVGMMIKPGKAEKYADYLHDVAQKRID